MKVILVSFRLNKTWTKNIILVQVLSKPERKSRKCHDSSDLNLNELEMAFKVNGKL